MRGSGSTRRKVSFSHPLQGVLLYEKSVSLIPAKQLVENYFQGTVDFAPMFDALYPPNVISDTHGLYVYWEIQLLLDKLVDQELKGPIDKMAIADFFSDGS